MLKILSMKLTRCKCVGRHTYTLNCNSFPFFHTYELILHFTPLRSRTRENYQHNHESEGKRRQWMFCVCICVKIVVYTRALECCGRKNPTCAWLISRELFHHTGLTRSCIAFHGSYWSNCVLIPVYKEKKLFSTFSHAPNRTNVEAVGSVYGVAGNFSLFVHSPRSCAIGVIKFCVRHSHSNSRQKKNNFSSDRSN